jgi:hypothetical protein
VTRIRFSSLRWNPPQFERANFRRYEITATRGVRPGFVVGTWVLGFRLGFPIPDTLSCPASVHLNEILIK